MLVLWKANKKKTAKKDPMPWPHYTMIQFLTMIMIWIILWNSCVIVSICSEYDFLHWKCTTWVITMILCSEVDLQRVGGFSCLKIKLQLSELEKPAPEFLHLELYSIFASCKVVKKKKKKETYCLGLFVLILEGCKVHLPWWWTPKHWCCTSDSLLDQSGSPSLWET